MAAANRIPNSIGDIGAKYKKYFAELARAKKPVNKTLQL